MAGAIGGDAVAGFGARTTAADQARPARSTASRSAAQSVRQQQRGVARKASTGTSPKQHAKRGGNTSHLHAHRAVVLAAAAAACWKLRVIGRGCERGRDQRKAEDEHQQ